MRVGLRGQVKTNFFAWNHTKCLDLHEKGIACNCVWKEGGLEWGWCANSPKWACTGVVCKSLCKGAYMQTHVEEDL